MHTFTFLIMHFSHLKYLYFFALLGSLSCGNVRDILSGQGGSATRSVCLGERKETLLTCGGSSSDVEEDGQDGGEEEKLECHL